MNASREQRLIHVNIANANDIRLIQQERLDLALAMLRLLATLAT